MILNLEWMLFRHETTCSMKYSSMCDFIIFYVECSVTNLPILYDLLLQQNWIHFLTGVLGETLKALGNADIHLGKVDRSAIPGIIKWVCACWIFKKFSLYDYFFFSELFFFVLNNDSSYCEHFEVP